MGFLSDWFNWSNFLYLVILILAAVGTLVSTKLRVIVAELKELFEVVREANEDGKYTEKEKEKILKKTFDVLAAILKAIWKPVFKVKK